MKPIQTDPNLFTANRNRLRGLLPRNAVAVVHSNDILPTNADGSLPHFQNADLYYLTGILQEESILVIAPDAFEEKNREILFLREPNENADFGNSNHQVACGFSDGVPAVDVRERACVPEFG